MELFERRDAAGVNDQQAFAIGEGQDAHDGPGLRIESSDLFVAQARVIGTENSAGADLGKVDGLAIGRWRRRNPGHHTLGISP